MELNSLIPLAIWKMVYPKIEEEEFIATYKFAISATVFPVVYFLQATAVGYFFGVMAGLIYLVWSFTSVYILTKSA